MSPRTVFMRSRNDDGQAFSTVKYEDTRAIHMLTKTTVRDAATIKEVILVIDRVPFMVY